MALKKNRINRLVPSVHGNCIIEMQPSWKFSINSANHGEIFFDFSSMLENNREELAGHMRDAIWNLRYKSEGVSLLSYFSAIKRFWLFLDDIRNNGFHVKKLVEIDRKCIDQYLTWLELQIIPDDHLNAGKKHSSSSKRNSYSGLKTLLINRKRFSPSSVSVDLSFPTNPFPHSNQQSKKREPYSATEHKRINAALNKDLRAIHESENPDLPSLQVLVTYLLVLASSTGVNLQPLLELRRDSLRPHPLDDREILITEKRRGWTSFASSTRKSEAPPDAQRATHTIPISIGEHFRALSEFTLHLKEKLYKPNNYVFLWQVSRGARKNQIIHLTRLEVKTGIRDFAKRHNLLDDHGNTLALSFGRFRPSYIGLGEEVIRNQALMAEGMVASFTKIQSSGKLILAADGSIPSKEVKFLAKNGYSTGVAHCRNPFRDEESVCKKFFTCFHCPNMLIFEDDLWRLFSFYFRLLSERTKIRPDHWLKTYGPIIRRIDDDISPQFPIERVIEAKDRARLDPHPAWKDPL
jgi:hypothetical protein